MSDDGLRSSLGIEMAKRVQMKIDMGKGTMSITGMDGKERMVQTQLAPKEVLTQVPIVEIEEGDGFDEEEAFTSHNRRRSRRRFKSTALMGRAAHQRYVASSAGQLPELRQSLMTTERERCTPIMHLTEERDEEPKIYNYTMRH